MGVTPATATLDTELPTLELHFKPSSFWQGPAASWLLALTLAALGVALGSRALDPSSWSERRYGPLLVGASLVLLLALAAIRAKSRRTAAASLRAYPTHLELPDSAGATRARRVEYRDVLSLHVVGHEPHATLFLGTRNRLLAYAEHSFVEPGAIGQLATEVRRQIVQQPDGHELVARMNLREAIGQSAWATRPVATVTILIVLALAALIVSRGVDLDETQLSLARYGANAPTLVASGQWFRLFSANFLHGGLLHLYMNGVSLLMLGALLERLLGPWRFTLIYLSSAFGGALASALAARAPLSVGASTGIFGLLGALAVLEWRFRTELPGGFRQSRRWWVFILGLNALLPLLLPQIDVAAHAGGFVAGAVATRAICARKDTLRRRESARVRLVAALVVAVCVIALGQAAVHATSASSETDQLQIEESVVSSRTADVHVLNAIAWQYATSRSPSAAELELGLRAATSAAALEPEQPELIDTIATIQYRRGDLERAIDLERQTLIKRDDLLTISQVARFLDARRERRGPMAIGSESVDDFAFELDTSERKHGDKRAGMLKFTSGHPRGAEIWVLGGTGARLAGAWILRLGPIEHGGTFEVAPKGGDEGWRELGEPWFIALVDESSCRGCPAETLEAEYHTLSSEILALPRVSQVSTR